MMFRREEKEMIRTDASLTFSESSEFKNWGACWKAFPKYGEIILTNRMHDSFSGRSTIHVWEISVYQFDLRTCLVR